MRKTLIEFCIICMVISLSVYGVPIETPSTSTNAPIGPRTPPSSTCDAVIGDVYLDDTTFYIGDTIIIQARNDAVQDIFDYPGFKISIIDANDNKILFGEGDVNYYGIGSYYQTFKVKSDSTVLQRGQQIKLCFDLYSGFFDVWECTFNWIGNINIRDTTTTSLSPTETTISSSSTSASSTAVSSTSAASTAASSTSAASSTLRSALSPKSAVLSTSVSSTEVSVSSTSGSSLSSTQNSIIYCDTNDDTKSCGDNTCQCHDGHQCVINTDNNYQCNTEIIPVNIPSTATTIYKIKPFITIITTLFAILMPIL